MLLLAAAAAAAAAAANIKITVVLPFLSAFLFFLFSKVCRIPGTRYVYITS